MARSKDAADLVSKVMKDLDEDLLVHKVFAQKVDERYRAYRGIIEVRSQAAQWTNTNHPAYVLQAIETMVSNLIESQPAWRLKVNPIMDDAQAVERLRQGARANELLLQHQLNIDYYAEKQRPFDLQGLIAGLTVSKQFWWEKTGPKRSLEQYAEPVIDMFGVQIGEIPRLREVERQTTFRDDPCSEVVDVRDWIWQRGATSLANCSRVAHRLWFDYEDLEQLEAEGKYGKSVGGESVKTLKDSRSFGSDLYSREQELFEADKSRDKIEVMECWVEKGRRIVTIANRSVLLMDKENPFWFEHLEHMYPFVCCSAMPDLFVIPGISEVELMAELQEMLWTLMNQRLDNLQLINNAIFLVADDTEDPDAFEFAPGERWLVPRPVTETVKPWSPDPAVATISLSAESQLRGDMQNVTGGMPYLSGTESASIDQKTATGVSIVTSLAQKRLATKKQMFTWAKRRIGEQWCALNQQYVRSPRLVPTIGEDGVEAFEEIRPDLLQGSYSFTTEMAEESFLRQEKRAEAQSKLQMFLQAAPVYQALGAPLNPKAFMDDYLEAFDIQDRDRYYSAQQAQMPGQPPGQPSMPSPNGQGGVTAPQSVQADTSPSNPESMNPAVMMSRQLSQQGGADNA
jgi:hypothetical protein